MNITDIPSVVLTDAMEEEEILQILKCPGIKGVSGKFISQPDLDFAEFKKKCSQENIKMTKSEKQFQLLKMDAARALTQLTGQFDLVLLESALCQRSDCG